MPNIRIITSLNGRAQRGIGRAQLKIGRASALPGLYKTTPVGSGPAQQALLSEGSDPANPPKQTFELNLFKKNISEQDGVGVCPPPPGVFCNFFPTGIYNDTQFWI